MLAKYIVNKKGVYSMKNGKRFALDPVCFCNIDSRFKAWFSSELAKIYHLRKKESTSSFLNCCHGKFVVFSFQFSFGVLSLLSLSLSFPFNLGHSVVSRNKLMNVVTHLESSSRNLQVDYIRRKSRNGTIFCAHLHFYRCLRQVPRTTTKLSLC